MKSLIEERPYLKKHFMWHNPIPGRLFVFPVLLMSLTFLYLTPFQLVEFFLGFIVGILYWSFFEYGMHRYIYHIKFKSPRVHKFWMSFHLYHHGNLEDKGVLNANYLFLLPMAFINILILSPLIIISSYLFVSSVLALILSYIFYEWVHYSIHTNPFKNKYIQFISKYHLYHHHKKPNKNFGNTTTLWDKLLNTYDPNYKEINLKEIKY
jgi:sterol desaturase/sphingolipid hydroxylase (fatty acid hydroxylase superfamily)